MTDYSSTIAAISTPPGKGGVAIIRISGTDALEIASEVFIPRAHKSLKEATPRMQIRGDVVYLGHIVDDGMATYFKAPNSYTGEDIVEIACHGGVLVTRTVLEALFANGAMPASAGEFTRRAFINGKISLVEAEAIGNLLEAESLEQVKLSSVRSRELLTVKISEIRDSLTSVLSSAYARIDYPDEDLGDFTDVEAIEILEDTALKIERLIATYQTGKAVREGVKTVICGKPNVGKSTLYNLLLGREAAIVTDIEGTTRDVLTERIPLGKVLLSLSDTAGVRRGNGIDPVEQIGISRSIESISSSELILAVFDLSGRFDEEDKELLEKISESSAAKIAVLNKSDLDGRFNRSKLENIFDFTLEISAKGSGDDALEKLTEAVNSLFTDEKITVGSDAIISSARQNAELVRSLELVRSAIDAYKAGFSQDAAASDVERALGAIAELDGRAVSESVVADIFSKFCVGK